MGHWGIEMDFDVFLCHNSQDKDAVKEIGQRLRDAGLNPWLDEWELRPGLTWQDALEEQIETIRTAAIFVGPDGFGPWQKTELRAFISEFVDRGCPVIPLILAGCEKPPKLPIFLKAFTWVDFRKQEPDPFECLVWGITGKKPDPASAIPAPKKVALPLNNLPFGSLGDLFKGREDQLADLESKLGPNNPTALVQAKTLSGLGGVGKTRLAIEFAYRYADRYTAIFFVNADGEAELRRNFAGLAERDVLDLKIPPGTSEDAILKEVKVALRDRPDWLLIFDNVDSIEAQKAVRRFLPLPGGQVVITTRLQLWPREVLQLEVDKLDAEAARDYLLKATEKRHRRTDDESSAEELAERLDCLPLALELMAAYLNQNHRSFREVLANWETEEGKLVDWYDETITEYPRSLAKAWSLSFQQLDAGARALLNLLAHLAPEPIAQQMLEESKEILREAAGAELDLDAALVDLERYSLLTREREGEKKTLTLHRLVQAVARGRIPAEERAVWAERAVRLVHGFSPAGPADVRSWPVWDPLRPHAARVIEFAEKAGIGQSATALMNQLAVLLWAKALHAEAEPLMRRALEIDEASLGKDHPKVAIRLNNLAQVLQATNRLAEAEPLVRRALEIDEASFGQDHSNVARHLNSLATLLQATNRLAEAEPLMRRALEIDEASFGKDHPDVAIDLNNLALLLQATNRLAEAEPLMRRALEIDEASFGKDHPSVARDLNNLATLLKATNRLAEAEPLLRRSLEIDEASFGKDHPNVARVLNNLANLLQATNRLAEAEPLMRRALTIFEASLGSDHPWTAISRENLAILLAELTPASGDLEAD